MKMKCGSPWCDNTVKATRKIDGVIVCRACYQYVWEQSQKTGEPIALVFSKVEPPKRPLVRIRTKCFRPGCKVILTPEMDSKEYRWIERDIPICRNCYETTWEYKTNHKLSSFGEAFDLLNPKGWEPPQKEPATCEMPWCKNIIPKRKCYLIEGERYVCGKCKNYLHVLSRRHKFEHDWKWYAVHANQGIVPTPGAPEFCSAKWCKIKITGIRRRGPKGEALCNNDAMHFYLYARNKGISFAEAFQTAPPPRLLHTRGRMS